MKQDESRLFEALRDRHISGTDYLGDSTFDISERLGIPNEVATQYVLKWADRGWYDYGMRPLFGWLTPQGLAQ